ncbi:MAG: hypothetical protein IK077_14710 [Thermoguttaceae bacterium]|nr:hypothetical protein [Thermoguttaceae bacterium]
MPLFGQKKRDYENERSSEETTRLNEIAPIPECSDPSLREELEADPARWLREILPDIFFTEFTDSQLEFIRLSWQAIVEGAWKNSECYRGFGKTSILSGLLFDAMCQGIVRHALYVTAEGGASAAQAATWFFAAMYDDYQAKGKDARLFTRLYPEISYPLQRREGKAQRPLTCDGVPCRIEMKSDRIVFPNVPGSRCAGSLLRFTSISSGGIRGANHTIPGVGSFRVRCVMLDDVQNDSTAKSVVEVDSIMTTIQKTIRGLAGRRKDGSRESLTVLSAITQNQPGDVAERMIADTPEFNTIVLPFVKRLPDSFDAWKKYRDFREATLRKASDVQTARRIITNYYKSCAKTIGAGVEVDDPRMKENWQADAIHYAVDYWAASESSFWCEFQNDARRAAVETGGGLTAVEVARKIRKNADGETLKRCWVPNECEIMTAHIDAGEHYLNYEVVAYSRDFRIAHVVDFGIWPEQPGNVASKKRYAVDLQDEYSHGDKFDRLREATLDLLIRIFCQTYFDEYGEPIDVDEHTAFEQHARARGRLARQFCRLALCGVDCGDGEMELALWGACDAFHRLDGGRFFGRSIPTYGTEAASRLMRYYDLKTGEWRRQRKTGAGYDWIENPDARRNVKRAFPNVYACLNYDANTAKTRRDSAWKLPIDREGSATIFDGRDDEEAFAEFCRHQTAEEFFAARKSGLEYRRWRMKRPAVSDNEYLDTDAACRALAEYVGCEIPGAESLRHSDVVERFNENGIGRRRRTPRVGRVPRARRS